MRTSTSVLAAILVSILAVPAALADRPVRQPLPAPPSFTISGSCSFDVNADVLVNKEFATTFSNGMQIITGRLVVRLTNAANPSKSVVVQVNGPGKEDLANPSTFNLSGSSLIFGPGVGGLLLTRGPVSLTFDENGNVASVTQTSASSVDLCTVLADP
jgi:hypothetical protein